jgi:hypothetical protein
MTYVWHETYKTANEMDEIQERLQSAESAIHEHQRVLSMDHGEHQKKGKPSRTQSDTDQTGFVGRVKLRPSPPCSFVATRTAKTVAMLRTSPAIVKSASKTGGWFSASPSSRALRL